MILVANIKLVELMVVRITAAIIVFEHKQGFVNLTKSLGLYLF